MPAPLFPAVSQPAGCFRFFRELCSLMSSDVGKGVRTGRGLRPGEPVGVQSRTDVRGGQETQLAREENPRGWLWPGS